MEFDVLVIGAGHAGCEAAAVAARLGARVALITRSLDDIGTMSCNPAIGGLGKGHLVREVDALDGLIGRVGDAAALQFRLLNRSKGPAVQGPRAQIDRRIYARSMRAALADQPGLTIVIAEVESFITDGRGVIAGVGTTVGPIGGGAIVVTTGTFLAGTLRHGTERVDGGRADSAASTALAAAIAGLGLRRGRFKTGTPPRLDGRTIAWGALPMQVGDPDPTRLSTLPYPEAPHPTLPCGITRTTPATHDLVRAHLGESPTYGGTLGSGPRYCPSLEDKVARFGDRDGHPVYLEPEGFDDFTIYPNGISMALPRDVQQRIVQSIPGLERAIILRPGYAVDYDYVDPRQLTPALAVHAHPTLFLAGQINGTTGYEEAAGQGIVAGINATRRAAGDGPIVFDRASSYLGVMVDDLVHQGVSEPYRMFTSRAEYRLSLRIDNAEERLTPVGLAIGAVGPERARHFAGRTAALDAARRQLATCTATPAALARHGVEVNQDGVARSAAAWLAHPVVDWATAVGLWPLLAGVAPAIAATLTTDMHYAVYLDRQARDIAAFRGDEALTIDPDLRFDTVAGLSHEMIERLVRARPATFGAAVRTCGVTPGALVSLLAHVRRAA